MGHPAEKEEKNEIQYDHELDLQILREDLAAELLALNQYQEHAEAVTNEEAGKILAHIRDEKKEHVATLFMLIQKLDSIQSKKPTKER